MNKKGAVFIYVFMLAVLCFFLGYALASPLSEVTYEAYTNSQIDCTNSSISNQNKAVCAQIDIIAPVFVGIIFGLGGALLGYKVGA